MVRTRRAPTAVTVLGCALLALVLTACGGPARARSSSPPESSRTPSSSHHGAPATSPATSTSAPPPTTAPPGLPTPASVAPFPTAPAVAGEGSWAPSGRPVDGTSAVFETTLVPPGGSEAAGIAWMDTRLLSARLYSGSASPGGGPYPYTAPVQPAQATSLVAAFNGGFKMASAGGGYYTTGKTIVPLVPGAASLVIDTDGSVAIGAWGTTVGMTPNVVSVRQNLVLLVANGSPTPQASSPNWISWGATCGISTCTGAGVEDQWRSGVGVTADGALVYVTGPALSPIQLADLLARAGAVRALQLDINPDWTVFVTYDPATPNGAAAPTNGSKLLAATVQGPATFFDPAWARDFITMSARPGGA